MSTAVGGTILPKVIAALVPALRAWTRPLSVLLCENLRQAGGIAARTLAETAPEVDWAARVAFVETSIGKMVPIMPNAVRDFDPLEVWAERYNRIVADADAFLGAPPEVPGLVLKPHFAAHVDCKLFVHNLGHAAAAYHGFLHGHTTIREALRDPWIRAEACGAMDESAAALAQAYPAAFTPDELNAHRDDLLQRFDNPALGDTVFRVGRDLLRKLAPDDRCFGALALTTKRGVDPEHVCRALAAALCFRATDEADAPFAGDLAFHREVEADGRETVLRQRYEATGIANAGVLVERILQRYAAYVPGR